MADQIERRSFLKGTAGVLAALAAGDRLQLFAPAPIRDVIPTAALAVTSKLQYIWLISGDTLSVYYKDGQTVEIHATETMKLTVDEHGFIDVWEE